MTLNRPAYVMLYSLNEDHVGETVNHVFCLSDSNSKLDALIVCLLNCL